MKKDIIIQEYIKLYNIDYNICEEIINLYGDCRYSHELCQFIIQNLSKDSKYLEKNSINIINKQFINN